MIQESPVSEEAESLSSDGEIEAPVIVPVSTVDGDIEVESRLAEKPDVSHLAEAVQKIEGVWTMVVGKGDYLVIDYSALKYGAWMDTKCWMIDTVREDGFLGLWDPHLQQFGCSNWKVGIERGLVFKIATKGDWKQPRRAAVSRNSPMRKAVLAHLTRDDTTPGAKLNKKKSGRPKGKLNARTIARLAECGHDALTMSREDIDAAMAKIRKREYEVMKEERRRLRVAGVVNKDKVV